VREPGLADDPAADRLIHDPGHHEGVLAGDFVQVPIGRRDLRPRAVGGVEDWVLVVAREQLAEGGTADRAAQ
jgi:hypothetical protein